MRLFFATLLISQLGPQGPAQARSLASIDGHIEGRSAVSKTRRRGARRTPFVQLSEGPGYTVREASRSWGTALAISRIQRVMSAYTAKFPDARPVWIHDVSHRRGGRMAPHLSHRDGRDVDIRLVQTRPSQFYSQATPRTLDAERNWFLVRAFADSCDVEMILLDRRLQRTLYTYARKIGVPADEIRRILQFPGTSDTTSIVRHWPGHRDHMHVRFRQTNAEASMVAAQAHCTPERLALRAADEVLFNGDATEMTTPAPSPLVSDVAQPARGPIAVAGPGKCRVK